MANNLVVQLLLKTGTFSTDLKQAKGQVQDFQKGCQTAGKSVSAFSNALGINVGALTKLGGAIGAAALAGKAFKTVIDSNQTSADAFEAVMYSAKTAVNELAYAIGTFDFTNFQNGLSDLITRARDAAEAIDQLGDTLRSYNIVKAKARLTISQARAVIKNPKSTPEQIREAEEVMRGAIKELKESSVVLLDDYKNTMLTEVAARGAEITGEGAIEILDKVLTANVRGNREELKKTWEEGYANALTELQNIQKNYTKKEVVGGGMFGYTQTIEVPDLDNPEYQRELAKWRENNQEVIAGYTILHKYTDKQLDDLDAKRVAAISTEAEIADLEAQMETLGTKGANAINGTTKAFGKENEAMKDSLSYWKKLQQEAQAHRDMEVFNSTAWKTYDQALQDAKEHIEELEAKLRRYEAERSGRNKAILTPDENAPVGKAEAGGSYGLNGVWKEDKLTKSQLLSRISFLEKKVDQSKEGDSNVKNLNDRITGLNKRLEFFQVKTPTVDKKTIDSWDAFGQAMANVSTIVSNLTETFQEGTKVTAASILRMVSTSLPALSSLMSAYAALAGTEAVEKAVQSSKHWIEAIAAVAALGAAVASAISSAKSQKFANGGIVGGSSFTGDRVTAQVNSGEMILNKTQQANLFKMANGSVRGGQVEFHISGTDLVGVLNNQTRKNKLIR